MKIWLDDQYDWANLPDRHPPPGYIGVATAAEFRRLITEAVERGELIEALDFDNDLGDGQEEGWELAHWITKEHPEIFVESPELEAHSENPAGKRRIKQSFEYWRSHRRELIEAKERPHPWGEMERK